MEEPIVSNTFDLFEKGGMVMVPLLLLSVYGLAIVLYKVYQYWKLGVFRKDRTAEVITAIKNNRIDHATMLLRQASSPVSRVVDSILRCMFDQALTPEKSEAEVERIGNNELRQMESHMKGLEFVANVAPLMGLLGTVAGMVKSFSKLETGGAQIDPSVLAGGIWEALLTTVAGLTIAIPALAAYYAIDALVERVRASMKDATTQVLAVEDYLAYGGQQPQEATVHHYPSAPQQQFQQPQPQQQPHGNSYAPQQQEMAGSPFYSGQRAGGGYGG